jgi:hypothetical protein
VHACLYAAIPARPHSGASAPRRLGTSARRRFTKSDDLGIQEFLTGTDRSAARLRPRLGSRVYKILNFHTSGSV